jgi:hypothetical protein
MRAVIAGHAPPQVVKMKSATQTWPRSEADVSGRPERSTSWKAGSVPSRGSGGLVAAQAALTRISAGKKLRVSVRV